MTSMTARCSSDSLMSSARAVSFSLISTWWFHRFTSSAEGLVWSTSSVRLRATRRHFASSVATMCVKNLAATARLTLAVTLGLPSRSEPIQEPGWKNAGQKGWTLPALSPSTQSSKRR